MLSNIPKTTKKLYSTSTFIFVENEKNNKRRLRTDTTKTFIMCQIILPVSYLKRGTFCRLVSTERIFLFFFFFFLKYHSTFRFLPSHTVHSYFYFSINKNNHKALN